MQFCAAILLTAVSKMALVVKGWKYLIRIKDNTAGIASGLTLPQASEFDIPFSLKLTRKKSNEVAEQWVINLAWALPAPRAYFSCAGKVGKSALKGAEPLENPQYVDCFCAFLSSVRAAGVLRGFACPAPILGC